MEKKVVDNLVNELNLFADKIYEGNSVDIATFVNGFIPQIAAVSNEISDVSIQEKMINNVLSPMLMAVEDNDKIYLADIITFELLDILSTIE